MLSASISEFRKNIKAYLDKVTGNFETLIINRGEGAGVVVMSLDEYNALTATQHELSSRKDISRQPFSGIGKPEPLKHKYRGFWSRRINSEHRLIYAVNDDAILIAKCRFHYD